MTEQVERVEIEFLVMPRENRQGKLILVVCPLDEQGEPRYEQRSYFNAPKSFNAIGWICKSEGTLDPDTGGIQSLVCNQIEPIKPFDKDYVQYKLQDSAATHAAALHRKSKTSTLDLIDETIAPIAEAMLKTNSQGRTALLTLTMQRLMRKGGM